MASSNPFRRKTPSSSSSSSDHRRSSIDSTDAAPRAPVSILHDSTDDDPSSSSKSDHGKKKTPKKVRVLSPPPRSPDPPPPPPLETVRPSSLELFARKFPGDPYDPSIGGDGRAEGNGGAAGGVVDSLPSPALSPPPQSRTMSFREHELGSSSEAQALASTGPAANPFSKASSQDVSEHKKEGMGGAESPKPANTGSRRSLNVDSFRRLLMTGAASPPKSPPPPAASASSLSSFETDQSSETEAMPSDPGSGVTKTDDSYHKASQGGEQDLASPVPSNREKKAPPPPPPSSRHGKALKVVTKEVNLEVSTSHDDLLTPPPAVTHQALAPVSRSSTSGSASDSSETSLSQDSLIKALNLEVSTAATPKQGLSSSLTSPPPSRGTGISTSTSKKLVPAPPPRRGHARAESKAESRASAASRTPSALSLQESDPPSRTSVDSFHSRPGSIRQGVAAPAPPPPRRPTTGSRQPGSASFTALSPPPGAPLTQVEHDYYTTVPESPTAQTIKQPFTKPPPPPSRQRSTRRPPSLHGVETGSRRVSAEGKVRTSMTLSPPPPPPPSRRRGSSSSSLNGPPTVTGLDGISPSTATATTATAMPRSSSDSYHALQPAADIKPRSSSSPVHTSEGKSHGILADLDALQREVDALRGKMN